MTDNQTSRVSDPKLLVSHSSLPASPVSIFLLSSGGTAAILQTRMIITANLMRIVVAVGRKTLVLLSV